MRADAAFAKSWDESQHHRNANGQFSSSGSGKWDEELPDDDHSAHGLAVKAHATMKQGVDALEASVAHESPARQAQMRADHADLYYEMHRAGLVANAAPEDRARAIARHKATRDIAATVAQKRFVDAHAAARYYEGDLERQVEAMRQHLLYAHSANVGAKALHVLGTRGFASVGRHLALPLKRNRSVDDYGAVDQGFKTFGRLTRSPDMIHVGFMDRRHKGAPAGLTITDRTSPSAGSIIAASQDPTHIATEVAKSLAMRHLRPTYEKFNAGVRERSRGASDPHEALSDHGFRSGAHDRVAADGERGDHLEDWAQGLSRSVAGKPSAMAHPLIERMLGPTRHSVESLAALTGATPHRHPAEHK